MDAKNMHESDVHIDTDTHAEDVTEDAARDWAEDLARIAESVHWCTRHYRAERTIREVQPHIPITTWAALRRIEAASADNCAILADAVRAFVAIAPDAPLLTYALGREPEPDELAALGLDEDTPPFEGDAPDTLPAISKSTRAMAKRFDHIALDNEIARAPLYLAPDLQVSGRPAPASYKVAAALIATTYARHGCPDHGRVPIPFIDMWFVLGDDTKGGRQYDAMRALLRGMQGCGVTAEWRQGNNRFTTWYGLFQSTAVTDAGSGIAYVHLTEEFQSRIRGGNFTYLGIDDVRRLRKVSGRTDVAQHLLYHLKSQAFPWPPGWPVFRPQGDKGQGARPIAELCGLFAKNHRKVVSQNLKPAAATIMRLFPEYTLTFVSLGHGMYQMHAERDEKRVSVQGTPQCRIGVHHGVGAGYTSDGKTPASTHEDECHQSLRASPISNQEELRAENTHFGPAVQAFWNEKFGVEAVAAVVPQALKRIREDHKDFTTDDTEQYITSCLRNAQHEAQGECCGTCVESEDIAGEAVLCGGCAYDAVPQPAGAWCELWCPRDEDWHEIHDD